MAVAYDAITTSSQWTTTPDPFTFTHTPVGTPRGILLFCTVSITTTDRFDGAVTYGGVAMTAVTGGKATDTGGSEDGVMKAYFLGSSIPTGAQTVSINWDAGGSENKQAFCISVTASADTVISGTPVLLQDGGTLAEQNVDSGSDAALRFAAIHSGIGGTNPPAGSNSTTIANATTGTISRNVVRETTGGSGSRPVGFSSASSDDRAAVHLAIAETGGGGGGAVTRSFAVVVG